MDRHDADLTPASAISTRRGQPHTRNTLLSVLVFGAAMILVFVPRAMDYPVTHLMNGVLAQNAFIAAVLFSFDRYFSFSGVAMMALVWSCWFAATSHDLRARLLAGTLVVFPAGILSRALQHRLSTHPRPFYDQALDFHLPHIAGALPLNTWNSFPSDHATVFGGLVAVIFIARPKLGMFALAWLSMVELGRVFVGAHYPTDLIGGAALGSGLVWASQSALPVSAARRIEAWEQIWPACFYAVAFFISYQIATLFGDIRDMVGGFSILHGK